jgi:molybdopterin synthase sulfur carrier subunit
MVAVRLWGSLAALAGDQKQVEVEAKDIRELFRKLSERYPALQELIENDIAVSIDGVIYRDTWSKALPRDAEIFLMRRLSGG